MNLESIIHVVHNKFQVKASNFVGLIAKNMKKAVTMMVLAAAILLTSCSTYTCPTYSKVPQKVIKETRI